MLLTRQHAAVDHDGELVVFCVADFRVSIEFDLALKIATALTMEGRAAKRVAGDESRHFGMIGILHNATPDAIPRRSRFAAKLPELLAARDVHVRQAGSTVEMWFGRTCATLAYADAMKIGKWMRLHGKAARNAAKETAHWSRIAAPVLAGQSLC